MPDLETLGQLIESFAARGEAPALVVRADGSTWSYRHLHAEILRLAAGLRALELEPGTRIGLIAPNRPEWVVAALGTIASGAVVVPLDTMMPKDDLAHALADSGCRRVFTTRSQREAVLQAAREEPEIWLLDSEEDGAEAKSWRSLQAQSGSPLSAPRPADTAVHFHTSGTTGLPKGVPLTHRNLASNVQGLLAENLADESDRACLPLPLFHVYPFTVGMLTPLAAGAAIIMPKGLSGPEILDALQEGKATAMIGVPRLYEALIAAIKRRAGERGRVFDLLLSGALWAGSKARRHTGLNPARLALARIRRQLAPGLKLLASGGARLDPETAYALEGLGWEVLSGYGLTETSPIVTVNPRGGARHETVGRPLRGVEIRTAEPDPEAGDEAGEVQVRGPGTFAGYYNLPDKTKEAFTEDGWFRTGDLGVIEDDYLRLVGRSSSRIVLGGGKNVLPEDVEAAYEARPEIREVAVLERRGELVALVVPNVKLDDEEAIAKAMREASQALPAYRRVSEYQVTQRSLPRSALGKIQRHKVADMYEAARSGREPPQEVELSAEEARILESEPARRVWELLKGRFPDKRLTMDASPQVDLGIDSIDWVDLSLDLQQNAGISLTEGALAQVETVRDLLEIAVGSDGTDMAEAEPGALTSEQARHIEPRSGTIELVRRAGTALDRAVLRGMFSLTVRNADVLPKEGPFVLAPNHTSYLDAFALAAALPGEVLEHVWWAGLGTITHGNAASRLFSRIARIFPVDPVGAPSTTLAFARSIVERGEVLVWFPEGQRSPTGELGSIMPGIGVLLDRVDCPVVPVHIAGAYEAWPVTRRLPRRAPVTVTFGKPITPDALADAGEGEKRHTRIADGLHRALADLIARSCSGR